MTYNEDKILEDKVKKMVAKHLGHAGFTNKITRDTPTDSLSLTNRKFVTANGTVANRPASVLAVTGQFYFATDTNIPMHFDGTKWRDGVGSVVASN